MNMTRRFIHLALAAALLTACATNDTSELYPGGSTDAPEISMQASAEMATTRAETDIQTALFDADEVLQGYVWHTSDLSYSFSPLITTLAPTSDAPGINPLRPNQQLYWPADPAATVSLYALYPQTVTKEATTFTVKYDQTSDADYKASDLMWGGDHTNHAAMVAAYSGDVLNIPFKHKMAKLVVNAATDGSVSNVVVTGITVKGLKRCIGFTPTSGQLGALSDAGDVAMSNGGACLLPPQAIAANTTFIEVAVTIDGNPATAVYKTGTSGLTMNEGHQYTLNIEIGLQSLALTSTITDWSGVDAQQTIVPKEWGSLTMAAVTDDYTYDGNAKTPTPAVTVAGVGTPLVAGTDFDYSYYSNTNAGVNTALVVATGKNGTDYVGQVAVQKFTIAKATPNVTAPTAATGLIYNSTATAPATAQALLSAAAVTDHGTIYYSLDNNDWIGTIPEATNADTYTVYYKVEGDANYSDVDPASVSTTIAKRAITDWAIDPTALTVHEDANKANHEGTVTVTYGSIYTNESSDHGDISVNNADANQWTATIDQTTNQITVAGVENKSTNPAMTVSVADGLNYTFSGSKTCTITVQVNDPGVALKNAAVGYIVSSNGKAYPTTYKSDLEAGTPYGSIKGMVAYKTSNSVYVISKSDYSTGSLVFYPSNPNNLGSAGSFYVADLTSTTSATWRLATQGEYKNMAGFTGGDGIVAPGKGLHTTTLANAGCDLFATDAIGYWTSTSGGTNESTKKNYFIVKRNTTIDVNCYNMIMTAWAKYEDQTPNKCYIRPIFKVTW